MEVQPDLNNLLKTALVFWAHLLWVCLLAMKSTMSSVRTVLQPLTRCSSIKPALPAAGKTVLVTTGRQAKTLHTVRALKEIGARVIVTDYEPISASALSLACDHFIQLPPLHTSRLDDWISDFEHILIDNDVDMVIPVSTINEVLFLGVAKDELSVRLPNVQWICPNLYQAVRLDDRVEFTALCLEHGIDVPESGVVTSRAEIQKIASRFPAGIMLKRVEASVNRELEIVHVKPHTEVPLFITPTEKDHWQWQRFVRGQEYSAWYICVDGQVTMSACYVSAPDLMHFDSVELPKDLDDKIRVCVRSERLTGQFAFDFFRCDDTGLPIVIECNPRASSILETVSQTPGWGEAFFGTDVSRRLVHSNVGFVYHKNCWPWTQRSEGHFSFWDPLPFWAAQIAWPLQAIGSKGLTPSGYHHIDVNICKIIVDEASPARDLHVFKARMKRSPRTGSDYRRQRSLGHGQE